MTPFFLFFLLFQQSPPEDVDALGLDKIQAVIETSEGEFVLEFYHEQAPNHVEHFLQLARQDLYVGTTFHSMVAHGIVQAGDPLTKDLEQQECREEEQRRFASCFLNNQ